jgi:hypothetical protein
MAYNGTMPSVLNPATPLGSLPLELVDQYQTASYIVVAGVSVRMPSKQDQNNQNSI